MVQVRDMLVLEGCMGLVLVGRKGLGQVRGKQVLVGYKGLGQVALIQNHPEGVLVLHTAHHHHHHHCHHHQYHPKGVNKYTRNNVPGTYM